jgi:peptidoglycan DL-endopeptidase CwlO
LAKIIPKQHTLRILLGVVISVALYMAAAPLVQAATLEQQIKQLQDQNSQTNAQKQALQQQALPLTQQVASLNGQIATLEQQIAANTAKRDALQADIVQAEADLVYQRKIMGQNIRKMYTESGMSTLEMLATSEDLSHYVDKEQYQVSLRQKIEASLKRIAALKKQLTDQKATVDKLLADQQAMQTQLDSQRSEVNRLLSLNLAQQQQYDKAMQANKNTIESLQAQQALENEKHNIGPAVKRGTGGYPYANAPWPNTIADPWGMYKRQCVSYTAWKVANSGRYMPYWGGYGDAKKWDDNARADGIPVDDTPQRGDVAVSNAGEYGHVMYVEAVNDDDTITVSQYNAKWDGAYSVVRRSTEGLVFIHF